MKPSADDRRRTSSGSFPPTATAAISAPARARARSTLDYLRQIAVAADTLGYEGVLLPTGRSCEDAWVVASSLIPATRALQVPRRDAARACQSPGLAARMAATLRPAVGGRLLINVVTGGDPVELEGDGVFLDHDARYEITDEFLRIWRAVLAGEGGDDGSISTAST